MTWVVICDRTSLIDLSLNKQVALEGFPVEPHWEPNVPQGRICCLWPAKPASKPGLPPVIVTQNARDFLAWSNSYLPEVKPISAFCRTIEARQWKSVAEMPMRSERRLGMVLTGLILGELLSLDNERLLSAFVASYTKSYAMARAMWLGYLNADVVEVGKRWQHLRRIIGDIAYSTRAGASEDFMTALLDADSSQLFDDAAGAFSISLRQLLESPLERLGEAVGSRFPAARAAFDRMHLRREDRVVAFESAAMEVCRDRTLEGEARGAVLGLLASRIAPGTLDHVSVIRPWQAESPTAILWYGVFAGLAEDSRVCSFRRGLGRRINRDLTQPFWLLNPPTCDIGFDELSLATKGEAAGFPDQPAVSIELMPGVNAFVRRGPLPQSGQRTAPEESTLDPAEAKRAIALLEEVANLLKPSVTIKKSAATRRRSKGK